MDRRLLVVADTLGGGLGASARDECIWFLSAGWEVALAAPAKHALEQRPALDLFDVRIPRRALAPAFVTAVRDLRRAVKTFRPTVIHCHGLRSFAVALAAGTRPCVTLHGSGRLADESRFALSALLRAAAIRLVPRISPVAVSVAPGYRGWRFVPHASPRLRSLSTAPLPADGLPTFVWVGRLDEPKRPEIFVAALAAAARTTPLCGVVVGDGRLKASLQRMAVELDAPITFLGHSDDVVAQVRSAWAIVLFSRFEGVPFAVQEAMWAGRSVVVSGLPSLEWLVGDAGVFADSVDEAAAAFVLLSDRAVAAEAGQRAASHVRTLVDPAAPWAVLESIFVDGRDGSHR